MYIHKIEVSNFRCLKHLSVEFGAGVNVIIGENNAGKTTLIKAMGLVFNRNSRPHIELNDFHQEVEDLVNPPQIMVTAILRSSGQQDRIEDKALVASWLTKLDQPWEATLTFKHFLPEEDAEKFRKELKDNTNKEDFWSKVEVYLPKYVSRIYAGNPATQIKAEPDLLEKIDFQFLDAIRDVESKMFSGSNPLLKRMLVQALDLGALEEDLTKAKAAFSTGASDLLSQLLGRLNLESLFSLVERTGAKDGGEPGIKGRLAEADLLAALSMFVKTRGISVPATHNGLGYNNLIYISLLLKSMEIDASTTEKGQNAVLFPMLLIEEPEAHLHPALQYKLLKYVQERIKQQQDCRQVFVTTHSTHITSAVDLDSIICLFSSPEGVVRAAYPGKVFSSDNEGKKSKQYVQRYLDATKSNMLFAKGVLLVEGMAEQILMPCLAEYVGWPLEQHHVALIAVDGVTFKHFLPLFGAGVEPEKELLSLRRKVACIVDADPTAKKKNEENSKFKKCWPYQLGFDGDNYEYHEVSHTVANLKSQYKNDLVEIFHGVKTLEYDLAEANGPNELLLTSGCTHRDALADFILDKAKIPAALHEKFQTHEGAENALSALPEEAGKRLKAKFASYYLLSVESAKGEHAFELEYNLRNNIAPDAEKKPFAVPEHIQKAIHWVCS